jgi:DNA-binding transcriptional LysR family regulator
MPGTKIGIEKDEEVSSPPEQWKIDPKTLRLFTAVIEVGTIAGAAQREHIASSALSKRIRDLEYVVGTPLVNRGNKGVSPTAAGQTLFDLARRVLNEFDGIYTQMREYASGAKGQVRIFANISSITQFLPKELQSFLAAYPGVQVRLEDEVSSAITQAVADNAADVGILVAGPPVDNLEFFPYREDRLALIAPQGHPLTVRRAVRFADTLEFDYVGLHTASNTNVQLIHAASQIQRSLRFPVRVKSYDALCLMVEAGLGLGVLPKTVAESYARAMRIRVLALKESWAERSLAICVRSYASLPIAARLFVDHLRRLKAPVR